MPAAGGPAAARRSRLRRAAVASAAALAVVAALAAAELLSGKSDSAAPRPAPALPTAVLQPPRATLAALRGKPALVAFWASWCGPCREDAPHLRQAARALGGRASVVAVDWDDGAAAARAFLGRARWPFAVLSDTSGGAGERYGLVGLPTTYVLDPSGRIVATLRGPQSAAELEQAARAAA
jgi:cytochrome c biogenesis protein CcmG/thiol:disulfide interchange protein DsbE